MKDWIDLRQTKALWRHVWRHFKDDRCFDVAGSLSYTSLLAMVPLLVVTFKVLTAFDVFSNWGDQMQNFIFNNFVPGVGNEVLEYIQGFMQGAGGLTALGSGLLLITSLLLMLKIERTLNRIWRVQTPRSLGSRIIMYWAVLTLAPLLMGAGMALTAMPALERFGFNGQGPEWLNQTGIFVFTWLALSMVFLLVPNRPVNWRHAALGGLVSALLFQLAKYAFVSYVSQASYTTIYQSLATVPIFLLWLYLSWLVLLLGASLAAALTTFSYRRAPWRWQAGHELHLLYRIVGHLWQAQRRGQTLSGEELLLREEAASDSQIQRLLGDLQKAGIATRDELGHWLLARDIEELSLADLMATGHYILPLDQLELLPRENHWDTALHGALVEIRKDAAENLCRPLKSYYLFSQAKEKR